MSARPVTAVMAEPSDWGKEAYRRLLRYDGLWPACGSSPEQAQFTDLNTSSASYGASFCIPTYELSALALQVAHDAVQARFKAAA
jgi:hypothetical protein